MTENAVQKTSSLPALLLRLEGMAVFIAATIAYGRLDGSWLTYTVLLLVPDLFMIGYLLNAQQGSVIYNAGHTYVVAALLAGVALAFDWDLGLQLAVIWTAHIGMDRALGFGLKYPTLFKDTHLQRI